MKIILNNIGKSFVKPNWIFRNINLELNTNEQLALLGNNGSGKSSLLQIISGHLLPTEGSVNYFLNEKAIDPNNTYEHIAFVSPQLELVEEFTLIEFLNFHFSIKKPIIPIEEILEIIGLTNVTTRKIENFSSGMKQRVKLAHAFFADVPVILLDEPCSNLDEDGYQLYNELFEKYSKNKIVIVASNDHKEYEQIKNTIDVRAYK